ncbi:hypothetical protein BJ878DRAFT_535125 [Calycina marina]|uniref:NmrA-like domain-containing protein n=1 Tax=Calycina marina TaxID=1763456 RepID=A0A9P7Z1F3_9HELO|nr:hypothetical protein BJ878DRAFT_535125 [Calycina marina]
MRRTAYFGFWLIIRKTSADHLATVASSRRLGRTPSALPPTLSSPLKSLVQLTSYHDIPAVGRTATGVSAVINAYMPNPILDLEGYLLLLRAAECAGVQIFLASSWSCNWTNIKYNSFENYNDHIHFEQQVATTSPIKPVYLFSSLFADLLYTVYLPGAFDDVATPLMKSWGNGDGEKYPWSTQEYAAESTIDILLRGKGVQAGDGGYFKLRSGVTTVRKLVDAYEKVLRLKFIDLTYLDTLTMKQDPITFQLTGSVQEARSLTLKRA